TCILVSKYVRKSHARSLLPLPLDDMEICATETGTADAHDDVVRTGDLRLVDLLDHRWLLVLVHPYRFHAKSSRLNSSVPVNREPGMPQARKNAPVVMHSSRFTSLTVLMSEVLRRAARATLALVAGDPSGR